LQIGVVSAVLVWRTSQWGSLDVSAGVGQAVSLVEEATGTEVTQGILGTLSWAGRPAKRVDIRRVVEGWIRAIVFEPAGESEEQWKGCDCFDDHGDGLGSLLGTESTGWVERMGRTQFMSYETKATASWQGNLDLGSGGGPKLWAPRNFLPLCNLQASSVVFATTN
jgi:hypothetical protein